jgi:hypothetical protein
LIAGSLPAAADAACTNPDGSAGDQFFNVSYSVMQYCNGASWVNMGSPGSGGLGDGDKGDITVSSSGEAWAIDSAAVTNSMLAGSIALSKLSTSGTASSSTFLRGDGAWTGVNGLTDGDKGDITVSSSGAVWAIDAGAVTNSMLAGSIALSNLSITGTPDGSKFLRDDGTWAAAGSSTNAAGSDTHVQFNDGGTAFGGDSGLTFNKTTDALSVAGALTSAAHTVTSTSATALVVGANGTTNPVLTVNANTASVATGISVTGAAAASRVGMAVTSSGTNEGLSIDAKGSGTIRLGATSTGAVEFSRNAVPTASDGAALGTTSLMWSDLFLASGAVINFNNSDVVLTHSADTLTISGGNFAGSGSGLTNLNAGNLSSGTVGTARLGSGTANSSTFLRGDGTWNTPDGSSCSSNSNMTLYYYYQTCSSSHTSTSASGWNCASALVHGDTQRCTKTVSGVVYGNAIVQCWNGTLKQTGMGHGPAEGGCGGGGGASCFPYDTQVVMADGSKKKLSDVAIGESVRGRHGNNRVIGILYTQVADRKLWTINDIIQTTSDHPVLTREGWAAIEPEEYARREYNNKHRIVVSKDGKTEDWLYRGPAPASFKKLTIGSEVALGSDQFIKVHSLKSENSDANTKLLTLVVDGDQTMQLENGMTFLAFGVKDIPANEPAVNK